MAYAAVISLKCTIERHINPTHPNIRDAYSWLNHFRKLFERVNARNYRNINKRAINAFDAKIREAVCRLEDAIESNALRYSLPPSQSLNDESQLDQEIHSFLKTVKQFEDKYMRELQTPETPSEDKDPIHQFSGLKSKTVGLGDQFERIRYQVLNWGSGLEIISLVGMAGIGKTHLTRNIYQDPIIVRKFDCRAWVRAGPKAHSRDVLVDLVSQIERKPTSSYDGKDNGILAALLKKALRGRRYLIVLDDVWRTDVSDHVIGCLDRVNYWNRVLVTTRLEEVAKSDPTYSFYHVRFMNKQESWDLLWRNVFPAANESFPPQLERAGRKIAEGCEGLPLLILAVADILRGLDRTEEYWNKVADKRTSTFRDASNKIANVLSPSYDYLQQHLKACFLYLGVFPQSYEIPSSRIISLWIAENFFSESSHHVNLQDFSVECLEELVSNSVAIACKKSHNYRTKSSKLHAAYWHLCVKEARKNKFFLALNKSSDATRYYIASQRRLSVQNNVLFGIKQVHDLMAATSTTRSLLCTGPDHPYQVPLCFDLMFLRVLDALAIRLYEFPTEVLKLSQLRYLTLTDNNGRLPCSISNLEQLQCLILHQYHNIRLLRDSTCWLPKEIWGLQQLSHLRIVGSSNIPDPSHGTKLTNLITLYVNAPSCRKPVFRSIPNLRKLGIKIELQPESGETLSCLKNIAVVSGLESLKCMVINPHLNLRSFRVASSSTHLSNLPRGLKKLSLNGLGYSWECMNAIGSLPNLKVLKLRCSEFRGAEWEIKAGKFGSLEFLLLEDLDLMHWTIYGDKALPSLRRLVVAHCYKLRMIPHKIAFIRTLKRIDLVECNPSLVAYAKKLRNSANTCLRLHITLSWNL